MLLRSVCLVALSFGHTVTESNKLGPDVGARSASENLRWMFRLKGEIASPRQTSIDKINDYIMNFRTEGAR